MLAMTVPGEDVTVSDKIAGGFTETSLTNPYGDGKTYLAPMFYSPCGLFYNAGLLRGKGLGGSHHLGRDVGAGRQGHGGGHLPLHLPHHRLL